MNGAAPVSAPIDKVAPGGSLSTVSFTVWGWSATVLDALRPWESVAVSTSSRCDG